MALIGREHELELIASFLNRGTTQGEGLLLRGEPGVGKTALLGGADELAIAAGARVIRAAGVQYEADVAFSTLNQALLPLHAELVQLGGAHREALNVALGFGEGRPPERLIVSNAALALLREAATDRPLVVIVDDVQWVDRPSARVFSFVARRLTGSRIGFLAAERFGEESFFDSAGLPELELQPLADDAATELLGTRFPGLAPAVRQRLLVEAQGIRSR